jgi:thermopsin
VAGALVVLILSTMGGHLSRAAGPSVGPPEAAGPDVPRANVPSSSAPAPSSPTQAFRTTPTSAAFDQRVRATAHSLAAAGLPPDRIRLPYAGPSARLVDGVVQSGYAVSAWTGPSQAAGLGNPAPFGVAYYGENDSSGPELATTLNVSSVAGTITVNQLRTLYLDSDTPDMWGIQLNSILANVTLQGTPGYQFWTQNAVDYLQHNDTLSFGEDTWNFSSPSSYMPTDTSTILSHDPNGSVEGGIYIGEGPYVYAPRPFTLTVYLNSSVTTGGEQELWYNYTVLAHGVRTSGNYDWLIFNSTSPQHPASVAVAPFEASGDQVDPVGLPYDFELDFGIGAYDGSTMDVLAANATATLDYCPTSIRSCTSSEFLPVPAAVDYGSQTGETSSGLGVTFTGTTAFASAGPAFFRGLWGYPGLAGSSAGSTPVTNEISGVGAPVANSPPPYFFVFLQAAGALDTSFEWAPDAPTWYLAPGTYNYTVMLADYDDTNGTLHVGSSSIAFWLNISFDPASGVYTPLWAFTNAQLSGISTSGNGTLSAPYLLVNNPTESCVGCDGATDDNLSGFFGGWNDYYYPMFGGVELDGTNAYVELNHSVSFSVDPLVLSTSLPGTFLYLQIELVSTEHVTVANDLQIGGWPLMYELGTLAGLLPSIANPFPQANLMVWNSTGDLFMNNTFWSAPNVPFVYCADGDLCPPQPPSCQGICISPDELLLYGGTRNTIWGNTFENYTVNNSAYAYFPEGPAEPAGLAESESGDLIYNNIFLAENPTIYLPYDIYNDSCPDGYAGACGPSFDSEFSDTWNVTQQSANNVSAVVNGFPLSGNVLGVGCDVQGGNYWYNYGNSLNPVSTVPFTNVFDYSLLLPILAPDSSANESSIRVGGDSAPLSPSSCPSGPTFPVEFSETGLPTGLSWGVRVNGYVHYSVTTMLNLSLPDGTYNYSILAPAGRAVQVPSGTFSVLGHVVYLSVDFVNGYSVTFRESGLPPGTNWSVDLDGAIRISDDSRIAFPLVSNGTYAYSIPSVAGYEVSGASTGDVVVSGAAVNVTVSFVAVFSVTFAETGLPSGTDWTVTFGGAESTLATPQIVFQVPNGQFAFTIPVVPGYASSVTVGSILVDGAPFVEPVHFAANTTPTHSPRSAWPAWGDDAVIGGLLVGAVVVLVAVAVLYRRRGRKRSIVALGDQRVP